MAELIDLTGKKFGRLTVIRKGDGRKTTGGAYKATWICKCDCGNITEIDGEKIRKGHTTSCGCHKKDNRGGKFENLIGRKFNRLTVIGYVPKEQRKSPMFAWICKCDCGKTTITAASKLKNGEMKSCGCLRAERIGNLNRKYKYTNKRLYGVYKSMMARCYDTRHREYNNYGGRGIAVCDDWLGENGYDVFAEWAFLNGYDPNAKHGECTIERKNVDDIYCPDNCCWITNQQQQNNRRDCVKLEYRGEVHSKTEWARILNVPVSFVDYHVRHKNETIEETIKAYEKRKQ